MSKKRTQMFMILWVLLSLSLPLALSVNNAMAAAYPSKPVRLIVGYPAGGTTDLVGRLIASHLSERLGQQVFVENRGGGGGIVAYELTARSVPDGYTLISAPAGFCIQPALQELPYDVLKNFTPIARVVSGPMVLFVNEKVPVHSVKELIELAKRKPNELIFAGSGAGGVTDMAQLLFKMMTGIDVKLLEFKGGGAAMTDMLGGHSHVAINSIPQAQPHIKSGKFRVLATTGATRSVFMPDVPTIAEAGVPGFDVIQWFGVIGPAGIPAPIVDRLSKEIKAFMATAEAEKRFKDLGCEFGYLGPTDFTRMIERDVAQWERVMGKTSSKK